MMQQPRFESYELEGPHVMPPPLELPGSRRYLAGDKHCLCGFEGGRVSGQRNCGTTADRERMRLANSAHVQNEILNLVCPALALPNTPHACCNLRKRVCSQLA